MDRVYYYYSTEEDSQPACYVLVVHLLVHLGGRRAIVGILALPPGCGCVRIQLHLSSRAPIQAEFFRRSARLEFPARVHGSFSNFRLTAFSLYPFPSLFFPLSLPLTTAREGEGGGLFIPRLLDRVEWIVRGRQEEDNCLSRSLNMVV